MKGAIETPNDILWDDVLASLNNQLNKLYVGDQNHTRAALAIDIDLRALPLAKTQWGPANDARCL